MLILRAGLDGPRPRSRRAVARITGLGVRRVARAEARGLRRLRVLGHRGGCGVLSGAATAAVVPVVAFASFVPPGRRPAPRQQVKAVHVEGIARDRRAIASPLAPLLAAPAHIAPGVDGGGRRGPSPLLAALALAFAAYTLAAIRAALNGPR